MSCQVVLVSSPLPSCLPDPHSFIGWVPHHVHLYFRDKGTPKMAQILYAPLHFHKYVFCPVGLCVDEFGGVVGVEMVVEVIHVSSSLSSSPQIKRKRKAQYVQSIQSRTRYSIKLRTYLDSKLPAFVSFPPPDLFCIDFYLSLTLSASVLRSFEYLKRKDGDMFSYSISMCQFNPTIWQIRNFVKFRQCK